MTSFAKLASALLCAAACLVPAGAANRDYPIDYRHTLPKLAGIRVPILLPGVASGGTAEPFSTYVFAADVQSDHYLVDIWSVPGCGDATACRFAHMEAGRPGNRALSGERIWLSRLRVPAYFTPGRCGFGCADSTVAFDSGGWRYVLGIKGAGKAYIVHEAANLRRFAAPPGPLRVTHTLTGAEHRAALVKKFEKIIETAH